MLILVAGAIGGGYWYYTQRESRLKDELAGKTADRLPVERELQWPVAPDAAALGKAIDGSQINIASGTYNTNSGESYPFVLADNNLSFIGTNRADTIIDGTARDRVFEATSRTSTVRLLPPRLAGGISDLSSDHSSSVRSLG